MGVFDSPYTVALVVTLVVMWCVRKLGSRTQNLPPGPKGLPLIGVAWTLIKNKSDPLRLLSSWADTHGDIISFKAGPMTIVVLNSYKAICDAFQHPDLNNRPMSRISKEVLGVENNGIILANGEVWREQRNFAHSVFRSFGVGRRSFEENILTEVHQLLDVVEEHGGSAFDPGDLFQQAVANVICSVTFGTQYKYTDDKFKELIHRIKENLELGNSAGLLLFLPLPGISRIPFGAPKKLRSNMLATCGFFLDHIKEHEETLDPDNPRDLIDLYLNKMTETKDLKTSFSRMNLYAATTDLLFAGSETTSTTLLWGVLFMMEYPEVQLRVQAELDKVVGRERVPRIDDRPSLPYTDAVLTEIQRKGLVVPIGVPHIAAKDTDIYGYTIPKGATIVPNIWKVVNDPDLFENPDDFDPGRFLTADGKFIKKDELIFFSAGRRVCLGERLARMEVFLFFTGLVHRFTFQKPDQSQPLSLQGILGTTCTPQPYKTLAIKRE